MQTINERGMYYDERSWLDNRPQTSRPSLRCAASSSYILPLVAAGTNPTVAPARGQPRKASAPALSGSITVTMG